MKTILVCGGLGFIGSHTCVELLNNNYNIIIVDDLSNSKSDVLDKVKQIYESVSDNLNNPNNPNNLNKPFIKYFYLDLSSDIDKLDLIFANNNIDAVIHFAGYKAVNESIEKPLMYYSNNLLSTLNLLEIMHKYKCYNLIFSSSSTVYGQNISPLHENMIINHNNITNPYGRTKFFIEQILQDVYISNNNFNIICLRYFNPIGAHPSGLIGENPNNIPNNIMPYILNVVKYNQYIISDQTVQSNLTDQSVLTEQTNSPFSVLKIFGNNYNTPDGTCIRDYIHVMDVASGHLKALIKLDENIGYDIYNLGTGKGTSVLELINSFILVNNIRLPYVFADRRKGDIDIVYCDPTKANKQLDWYAKYDINDMVRDSYHYINKNI